MSVAELAAADNHWQPRELVPNRRRYASPTKRMCTFCYCGRRGCCCRASTRSAIRSIDRATTASRNPAYRWRSSSRRTCVKKLPLICLRKTYWGDAASPKTSPWVNHGANYTDRRPQLIRPDDPTSTIYIIIRDRPRWNFVITRRCCLDRTRENVPWLRSTCLTDALIMYIPVELFIKQMTRLWIKFLRVLNKLR